MANDYCFSLTRRMRSDADSAPHSRSLFFAKKQSKDDRNHETDALVRPSRRRRSRGQWQRHLLVLET